MSFWKQEMMLRHLAKSPEEYCPRIWSSKGGDSFKVRLLSKEAFTSKKLVQIDLIKHNPSDGHPSKYYLALTMSLNFN